MPYLPNFLAFNLKMQLAKFCQVPAFVVSENLEIILLGTGVRDWLGFGYFWPLEGRKGISEC